MILPLVKSGQLYYHLKLMLTFFTVYCTEGCVSVTRKVRLLLDSHSPLHSALDSLLDSPTPGAGLTPKQKKNSQVLSARMREIGALQVVDLHRFYAFLYGFQISI